MCNYHKLIVKSPINSIKIIFISLMGHGAAGVSWRVPASCFSQVLQKGRKVETKTGFSEQILFVCKSKCSFYLELSKKLPRRVVELEVEHKRNTQRAPMPSKFYQLSVSPKIQKSTIFKSYLTKISRFY